MKKNSNNNGGKPSGEEKSIRGVDFSFPSRIFQRKIRISLPLLLLEFFRIKEHY